MDSSPEQENERDFSSSRPLHHFTLPSQLKWGRQKHLRCIKSSQNCTDHGSSQSKSPVPINRRSPISAIPHENLKDTTPVISTMTSGGGITEIEEVREKLISDLKVGVDDHLKLKAFKEREKIQKDEDRKAKPSEEELPWNLRNRRAISKGLNEGGNVGSSPMQTNHGEAGGSMEQQQRSKFSLTLTKEEIETDFLLMTGAKPPRRPKKRSRALQKQIDVKCSIFNYHFKRLP